MDQTRSIMHFTWCLVNLVESDGDASVLPKPSFQQARTHGTLPLRAASACDQPHQTSLTPQFKNQRMLLCSSLENTFQDIFSAATALKPTFFYIYTRWPHRQKPGTVWFAGFSPNNVWNVTPSSHKVKWKLGSRSEVRGWQRHLEPPWSRLEEEKRSGSERDNTTVTLNEARRREKKWFSTTVLPKICFRNLDFPPIMFMFSMTGKLVINSPGFPRNPGTDLDDTEPLVLIQFCLFFLKTLLEFLLFIFSKFIFP